MLLRGMIASESVIPYSEAITRRRCGSRQTTTVGNFAEGPVAQLHQLPWRGALTLKTARSVRSLVVSSCMGVEPTRTQ